MIPLFSTKQIREIDNYAISKLLYPGIILMENASLQVYEILNQNYLSTHKIKSISIICGKGNNGGDGFATARHILNKDYLVNVIYLGTPEEMPEDCRINFTILKNISLENKNIKLRNYSSLKDLNIFSTSDVIIDALLGSGAKGNLRKPYDEIIKTLNNFKAFKVSIDIPTGLDSDLGYGELIFEADLTITLGEFKKGLFFSDGYTNCGKVVKGDIGVNHLFYEKLNVSEYLIEPEDAYDLLPVKKKNTYKYSAGKVLTIAGSGSLPGAAVLTAISVLKSGAGASILAVPKSVRKFIYRKSSEIVLKTYDDFNDEFLKPANIDDLFQKIKWADVVAIGPGLGREKETSEAVVYFLKERKFKNCVIDADAIFAIGNNVFENIDLSNLVLTPHHAEFANLIGVELSDLRKDLISYGKSFVAKTSAYLVLKGAPTMIFTPPGECFINTTGNPGMAKFGTGDVLTGVISGLLAQSKNIESAVISGVYLHSLSADLLAGKYSEYSYTAEDIIKYLPVAFKFLRKSFV